MAVAHKERTIAWKIMQRLGTFTIDSFPNHIAFLRSYLRALEKAKYIQCVFREARGKKVYRLVKSTGPQAPIPSQENVVDPNISGSDSRTRCWTAMRILKTFSISDVVICTELSIGCVRSYVANLVKAGFLKTSGPKNNRHYKLVRNSGPLAPCLIKNCLFDLNTEISYPLSLIKEEEIERAS